MCGQLPHALLKSRAFQASDFWKLKFKSHLQTRPPPPNDNEIERSTPAKNKLRLFSVQPKNKKQKKTGKAEQRKFKNN